MLELLDIPPNRRRLSVFRLCLLLGMTINLVLAGVTAQHKREEMAEKTLKDDPRILPADADADKAPGLLYTTDQKTPITF